MKKIAILFLILVACNSEENRIHKMVSLEAKYSLKYPETYEAKTFTELELVPANFYYTKEGKEQKSSIISAQVDMDMRQGEYEFDSTQLINMRTSSYSLKYERERIKDYERKLPFELKTIDSLRTIFLERQLKYKSDSAIYAKQQWYSITHFFNGKNAFGVPDQSIGTFYLNLAKDSILYKSTM
jgi:hypothetical protein